MSIISTTRNKPYDEPVFPEQKPSRYVYHFCYPMNSIDVRKVKDEQMQQCRDIVDFYEAPFDASGYVNRPDGADLLNYEKIKKMFKDHFPEELI